MSLRKRIMYNEQVAPTQSSLTEQRRHRPHVATPRVPESMSAASLVDVCAWLYAETAVFYVFHFPFQEGLLTVSLRA